MGDEVEGEVYLAELGVWATFLVDAERFGRSEFQTAAKARSEDFRVSLFVDDCLTSGELSEACRRCSEADLLKDCSLLVHIPPACQCDSDSRQELNRRAKQR
jgi:hypothetical protein